MWNFRKEIKMGKASNNYIVEIESGFRHSMEIGAPSVEDAVYAALQHAKINYDKIAWDKAPMTTRAIYAVSVLDEETSQITDFLKQTEEENEIDKLSVLLSRALDLLTHFKEPIPERDEKYTAVLCDRVKELLERAGRKV